MKTISELKKAISETEDGTVKPRENDYPEEETEQAEDANNKGGELAEKLKDAETRANENLDKYVRTLAEFDNFRKRSAKEKASVYDNGVMDVVKALLPVIDSFERALASCGDEDKSSPVYTGMTLIYKQLAQFMEDNGIAEIDAVGFEFDPEIHSAVAHTDDPAYGENEIIEELQKGYMLKDKVLRHSMVKVAN